MQKLYLDCDGVILDTIDATYKIIREKKLTDYNEIEDFYRKLNWDILIVEAGEIDNSIQKIKELTKHFDVEILTHIISDGEAIAKTKYFKEVLPTVNVITVSKEIKKADFVDPKGAILVDDYLPNLEYWYEKGGIPIKFSNSGKKCKYKVITDLLDLSKVYKK